MKRQKCLIKAKPQEMQRKSPAAGSVSRKESQQQDRISVVTDEPAAFCSYSLWVHLQDLFIFTQEESITELPPFPVHIPAVPWAAEDSLHTAGGWGKPWATFVCGCRYLLLPQHKLIRWISRSTGMATSSVADCLQHVWRGRTESDNCFVCQINIWAGVQPD